mmetsp:Transcript_110150/g.355541  ORF Transcript_110150/g.355541 Transcript_110150/m.355541 type:complete len:90 (+) Transcript_110150:297-566(+)
MRPRASTVACPSSPESEEQEEEDEELSAAEAVTLALSTAKPAVDNAGLVSWILGHPAVAPTAPVLQQPLPLLRTESQSCALLPGRRTTS